MSPEQAIGQPVDARSDLFSFGVMLYEMTTGKKPFGGETAPAVFDAIIHKTPHSPQRLNEELPPRLEQIIGKLLEKDPQLRFQSACELTEALRQVERDTEQPSSPGTFIRKLRRPNGRFQQWFSLVSF
jgi:serine/threonine protein kinase